MEGKDGILSISIAHCFPYADVPEIGTPRAGDRRRRQGEGRSRWRRSSARSWSRMRGKTHAAVPRRRRRASARRVAFNDLPVVIADPADNAGGGAPSDNTDILRHLIERKVENALLGPIWDPIAVRLCFDAGLGATFPPALRRQDRRRPRASRSMPRSRSSA